jgi:hypothetical protein
LIAKTQGQSCFRSQIPKKRKKKKERKKKKKKKKKAATCRFSEVCFAGGIGVVFMGEAFCKWICCFRLMGN